MSAFALLMVACSDSQQVGGANTTNASESTTTAVSTTVVATDDTAVTTPTTEVTDGGTTYTPDAVPALTGDF